MCHVSHVTATNVNSNSNRPSRCSPCRVGTRGLVNYNNDDDVNDDEYDNDDDEYDDDKDNEYDEDDDVFFHTHICVGF